MMVLVTYDVKTEDNIGQARLRNVAKACKDYGIRVQYSVFECVINPAQWVELKHKLISTINKEEDSLRFYYLGANWKNKIEHVGKQKGYDPLSTLIF
jgi:CRISPR-associated protein Cas2